MIRVAINAQLVSFAESYRNAGVSRFTYSLLEALDRYPADDLAYTVFVNSAEAGVASAKFGQSGRLQLEAAQWRTTSPFRRIAWEQAQLPRRTREIGAQVFHAPVNVLPERLPCPAVVTIHDLAFVRYPQFFRPTRRVYQRIFAQRSARAARLIVAVSASTRNDIIASFGVAPDRVRVIYPSVSPDFHPIADTSALTAFRARHDLPERYLLYLGTLEPRKNLLALVEAYAQLRSLLPDAPPLILAGAKGWYYESVIARVRALGLERAITFAGYVAREEQALWYAAAELFVYPSLYEGFGLPVAEALACGVPTLTSNVSSLPEVAGPLARMADPHDPSALAQAMRAALTDSTLRSTTRAEGPQWAARFSLERLAHDYTQAYRDAAGPLA